MTQHRLIAIGEALIDFIPDKTGCDFRDITAFSPAVGGAPANVCAAFARLGGSARLLTQLGDDPFGHKILSELTDAGIDTGCICMTEQAHTALAFVTLDADGNREFSFYRDPSADMLLQPEQLQDTWFHNCWALHFCSVCLGDFPMRRAHTAAISMARRQGGIISFDPNLRFPLWKSRQALYDAVWAFLPQADILKISDEELPFLTGHTDIRTAAPMLFTGNVKLLIYTCGSSGAWAVTQKEAIYVPSATVHATDTTGAGDGFIGAFLWKLYSAGICREQLEALDSATLSGALGFAHRFCAFSVCRPGAIGSYPTPEEMEASLQ
ncbi:MAG: carbohydrate kinase [Oscillospiraceae bacterium]|nr:carbohydrate kinase [Oscillospiraceae bacterium]